MSTTLLIRLKRVFPEGDIVELAVWQLASPVFGSAHRFKYRLVYVSDGRRVIGFDNERGKGDHQHVAGHEVPYQFRSVDRLLSDFAASVLAWRSAHGKPS